MELISSEASQTLVCGMALDLRIAYPAVGEITVRATIAQIADSQEDSGRLSILVTVDRSCEEFLEKSALFLVSTIGKDLSFLQLRRIGLPIPCMKQALSFSYLSTERDLEDVANLRLTAFRQRKEYNGCGAEGVIDKYDFHSRIVLVRLGGKLVATSRLTFNDGDLGQVEHRDYGFTLPDWLASSKFVEAGRSIVDPAYRDGQLFSELLKELGRICYLSGHRYLVLSAEDWLLPAYKDIGGQVLGELRFENDLETRYNLVVIDFHRILQGTGVNAAGWTNIVSPLLQNLRRLGAFRPGFFHRIKLSCLDRVAQFRVKEKKGAKRARPAVGVCLVPAS